MEWKQKIFRQCWRSCERNTGRYNDKPLCDFSLKPKCQYRNQCKPSLRQTAIIGWKTSTLVQAVKGTQTRDPSTSNHILCALSNLPAVQTPGLTWGRYISKRLVLIWDPHGSPVLVMVANLIMEDVEERSLTTVEVKPKFLQRYVDDTCTTLPADKVQEFLDSWTAFRQASASLWKWNRTAVSHFLMCYCNVTSMALSPLQFMKSQCIQIGD